MSLGTSENNSVVPHSGDNSSPQASTRTKPRMSAHERRLLKKRPTELVKQTVVASPIFPTEGDGQSSPPERIFLETDQAVNTTEFDLQPDLARQLSDASNHVAKRVVQNLNEEAVKVQKVLLYVAHAHRNGVISVREKAELKDLLLTKGSKAVMLKLGKYPGGNSVIKSTMFNRADDSSSISNKKTEAPASRYHVFRGLGCYSITMYVNEARKLEMALINGLDPNERCAVNSNFVALRPSQMAEELHEGTKQVLHEPNAGGKSFNSEALSFETLQALFGATGLVTEMNVRYKSRHCSIVDFVCDILGHRVGVSVTRAMHFLGEDMFSPVNAMTLLTKKLAALDRAAAAVCDEHRFDRQILHVWAQSERVGRLVKETYESLPDRPLGSNPTICLITVTDRLERFVIHNDPDMEQKALRDPFGFELLKRQVKKQEHAIVSKLLQGELERRLRVASAARRFFATSSSAEKAYDEDSGI